MPNQGKVPAIFLAALFFISLSLSGGAFYLFKKEKVRNIALREEMEDVRAKGRIIEQKLEDAKKASAQLESQVREKSSQIDFLSAELKKEKKTSQDAQVEMQQLKVELGEYKKVKEDAQQKLSQNEFELKKMQGQLKSAEDKRSELENKLKEAEEKAQKVELGTIVVGQEEEMPQAPALRGVAVGSKLKRPSVSSDIEGKIVVINKDYNFAVINVGNKDGVKINDIFAVYHKNKYVGDLKVEKVHDAMSAANFGSADLKDKIHEGDKVAIKNK